MTDHEGIKCIFQLSKNNVVLVGSCWVPAVFYALVGRADGRAFVFLDRQIRSSYCMIVRGVGDMLD